MPDKTTEKATTTQEQPTAIHRLMATYETAKAKVREASAALADISDAIKDIVREEKSKRGEVEAVRNALQKLQAIRV